MAVDSPLASGRAQHQSCIRWVVSQLPSEAFTANVRKMPVLFERLQQENILRHRFYPNTKKETTVVVVPL